MSRPAESAGCLVTGTAGCAVCGEEEGQADTGHRDVVKNYKQGGRVRVTLRFDQPGYMSSNQFRLCRRDGKFMPELHCH